MKFRELTPVNGFDYNNPVNARQNNYAWSMSELGDYIYVGTGRNILVNIIRALEPRTQLPNLIDPGTVVNTAEIWRYKKDGCIPWQKVHEEPASIGFRFMINHRPFGGSPAIYAAYASNPVKVLKTTNGVNWYPVLDAVLEGTSSRAMVSYRGKLYVATIDEGAPSPIPKLYSSEDPEFYPWEVVIDPGAPGFDPDKNPRGGISNMAVFNDRLYVATSNDNGAQVWRTNGPNPEMNEWTLIVDRGFGDPRNKYTLAMGVFKNYLYVSGTKQLPLAWAIPQGCDIIRIDKHDRWQLVVGGNPLICLDESEEDRRRSLSGLGSGFNNPFNVYGWQIQEYKGKLLISTFDDSSNMEVILTTLLANRAALEVLIGPLITRILIEIYESVVRILRAVRYPIGFDLYVSEDGVHFRSAFLNGLCNPNNYGGRILYVDSRNDLYLGTANPFQGCEVWKVYDDEKFDFQQCDENHYSSLWRVRKLINERYSIIKQNMPAVLKFIPKEYLQRFMQV